MINKTKPMNYLIFISMFEYYNRFFIENFLFKFMFISISSFFYWVLFFMNKINFNLINSYWEQATILCIFIFLDFITGSIASWMKWEISSRTGFNWILKKFFLILLFYMCYLIDYWIWLWWFFMIPFLAIIITNEFISIIENFDKMWFSIPKPLKQLIKKNIDKIQKKYIE